MLLTKDDLDNWGYDPRETFLNQDEELFLAEYEFLPLLLEAIDAGVYRRPKLDVLIEAICILHYDYTVVYEEYEETEQARQKREHTANRIRAALLQRKAIIKDREHVISDYIKAIVFPQLGLPFNPLESD